MIIFNRKVTLITIHNLTCLNNYIALMFKQTPTYNNNTPTIGLWRCWHMTWGVQWRRQFAWRKHWLLWAWNRLLVLWYVQLWGVPWWFWCCTPMPICSFGRLQSGLCVWWICVFEDRPHGSGWMLPHTPWGVLCYRGQYACIWINFSGSWSGDWWRWP